MREMKKLLTKKKILEVQRSWSDGIISIGMAYRNNEDYKSLASAFVLQHYGYDEGIVLFKPTLASVEQFRDNAEKALSYFISGNPNFPEDQGFAIKPWVKITFNNAGIIITEHRAVAMGNYYFEDIAGNEVKVEYTFGYYVNKDNRIKINVHHSSLPYIAMYPSNSGS
jgi:hypothetical protein